jgi:hypothetical protein
MPVTADTSPNILWPLPSGKPAFLVKDIFSEKTLSEIKNLIEEKVSWGPDSDPASPSTAQYHTITGRWVTEIELPEHIWTYLAETGKSQWGVDSLRLKNVWFTRYQKYNGVTPYLWEHMDQPGTQYTMDICIESPNVSWDIIVDGEVFQEQENSALFFMGQQQAHSRPPYPTEDENAYVIVMFALFVDSSHWMYDIDMYSPDQYDHWSDLMTKYKLDGDIRYYEYAGHAPRFDNLPEGNYECMGGECQQCEVVPENFTESIQGYTHVSE